MAPIIHNSFDPSTIPLQSTNLIEASAGTGKTYSIAILALRLILEHGMKIDQILMVTFTRDAAAEMELRVRAFIREALAIARSGSADCKSDTDIAKIVKKFGDDKKAVERLQDALVLFDKAAIYTIHGFCSRTLSEFAFESQQLFRSNTLEPDKYESLLTDAINQVWRENFTTLSPEEIRLMMNYNHSRKKLIDLVKGHLSGKPTFVSPDMKDADMNLLKKITASALAAQELEELVENNIDRLAEEKRGNLKGHAKTHLEPLLSDRKVKELLEKIYEYAEKKSPTYIKENIDEIILEKADEVIRLNQEKKQLASVAFSLLAIRCSRFIEDTLLKTRKEEGQIIFDDMITELHRAVVSNASNPDDENSLSNNLRKRYQAVFIDEFQDTDKLQYEIFSTLFQENKGSHILFYIGDPKQSIYAFRKADLQTYFRATKEIEHVYRMNKNYRSTKRYIEAMNSFFAPSENFDVFISDEMHYYPVEAPAENEKIGGIQYNERLLEPMRIIRCNTKEYIFLSVVNLVSQLLFNKNFTCNKNGATHKIHPGQIGILVRKNKDGRLLRKMLAKKKIMAVTVSDEKIWNSQQATELLHILESVENISQGNINRALLTDIAGFSWIDLDKIDKDEVLLNFRNYQDTWKDKGVYTFLRQFIRDSQAIKRQISGNMVNGERILSDTFQLMEMLHEAETEKHYCSAELINWLKKGMEGNFREEDQYLQRIESDENAVKIVSIHSSKGLEYDIILTPFLDLQKNTKRDTIQFHDKENYYTADKAQLNDALMQKATIQEEQENMRLLYVAITRARYHCYIFSAKNAPNSSLNRLLSPLLTNNNSIDQIRLLTTDENDTAYINFEKNPPEFNSDLISITKDKVSETGEFAEIPTLYIPDLNWEKSSYSKLTIAHNIIVQENTDLGEHPYDHFIFMQLRRGALTGNFLHDLFERIDFSTDNQWTKIIKSALARYPGTGVTEDQLTFLKKLLAIVTTIQLPETSFSLNQITRKQRLSEFEFDLPLTTVDFNQLPDLLEGRIPLRLNRDKSITGILNGKIDLVFEHGGRYFLLDWKSNHLGNNAACYNDDAINTAMEANNYYLQYYLYTMALTRYLRLRVKNFDYNTHFGGVYYLFIRGMRLDAKYGLYFHKPAEKDILLLENIMLAESTLQV